MKSPRNGLLSDLLGFAHYCEHCVVVTVAPTQISVNQTAQASAIVKDQNGNALTGKTVTWASLNPSVATVGSTTGVITGVAAGTAIIQGTVENVSGSVAIPVVAPATACPTATLCMLAASFSPTSITVAKGAVVGFQNESGVTHNIIFDAPKPAGTPTDIGLNSSGTISRTFDTIGTFNLHCTIHGGMVATVIVQ